MRKKNVTLTLKLGDAQKVCSHLNETFSHNTDREQSRIKVVRKLTGLITRAKQVNAQAGPTLANN